MEIGVSIAAGYFQAGDYEVAQAILSDGWRKTGSMKFFTPLMEVLERLGKLEAALEVLTELKNPTPRARLIEGLIAARKKDFSSALSAFLLARTDGLAAGDALTALRAGLEEAKCHEKSGDYAKAWSAMTSIRAQLFPRAHVSREYDRIYATIIQACKRDLDFFVKRGRGPVFPCGDSSPVLLTGHPRSGTSVVTVGLCKVLNRAQYDEPDAFMNALDRQSSNQTQIPLDQFDERKQAAVRADYFDLLRQFDPETDPQLPFIDKNPGLEMRAAHWLNVFPESTVILVQRHPLDIMVSCLFTYLPPNAVSLQYYTPERNAVTIENSLHVQTLLLKYFPENCTVVRYEDFIRNPSFAGINLPARYRGTEAKETTLHSPNYAQAREVAHSRSVRRFEHYLPYLPEHITKKFSNDA